MRSKGCNRTDVSGMYTPCLFFVSSHAHVCIKGFFLKQKPFECMLVKRQAGAQNGHRLFFLFFINAFRSSVQGISTV